MLICLNCADTIAVPEGQSKLACCDKCLDDILAPFSDIQTDFAKELRKLAQKGIKEIFMQESKLYGA